MKLNPTFDRKAHLARLSEMKVGTHLSQETKRRISESRIGRLLGSEHPNWNGGQFINGGYRYIYTPNHPNRTKDGYVLEHRLVMERELGRFLLRREAVHHINGDTLNNRPENLEVCDSNGRHSIEHHCKYRDKGGRFACA